MKSIESIQALRGIAAMAVLFFHYKELLSSESQLKKILDILFNNGFEGVDLFFILSGFLMVLITNNLKDGEGMEVAVRFFSKRIMRIWPIYALATTVYVVLTSRLQFTQELIETLLKSIFYLPLDSSSSPFYGYASLPVGWTLNYEFYFYFYISFSLLFRKFRWWSLAAIHTGLYLIMPFWESLRLLFSTKIVTVIEPFVIFPTTAIYINFFLGMLVGFGYVNPAPNRTLCRIFQSIGPFLILWGIFLYKYITGYQMDHGPIAVGWILFLAFLSTIFFFETKKIKIWTPLIWLGNISFSIYLWHLPVQSFLVILMHRTGQSSNLSQGIFLLVCVCCTLLVAIWSNRFLENRFKVRSSRRVAGQTIPFS